MLISGIRKSSLIDWPGRVVTSLFSGGCSFRCPWCHNPELIKPDKGQFVKKPELDHILNCHKKWIDGICLSGGEPLFQEGVLDFLKEINKRKLSVKLDTNGYHPLRLKGVLDKGLADFISMDIKAPLKEKLYSEACGIQVDLSRIKDSIELLIKGDIDYEFRTTAVPGIIGGNEIKMIAGFIKGARKYVLQSFRPEVTLDKSFSVIKPYSEQKMKNLIEEVSPFVEKTELR